MFSEKSEHIDFGNILLKYLHYWYLLLAGVVSGLGCAYLYLLYAAPQYHISTTLLIKDEKNGAGISENAAFGDLELLKSSKSIDNEMIFLRSNTLMQKVLAELSLNITYFKNGAVRNHEIYGYEVPIKIIISRLEESGYNREILIHIKDQDSFELEEEDQIRTVHQFGKLVQKPYGSFTVIANSDGTYTKDLKSISVRFNDIEDLSYYYSSKLYAGPYAKQSTVLYLSMNDAVPAKGVDIMNKLVEVYNEEAVRDKNLIAVKTLEFINERLNFLTGELSEVEKTVEQYKRQNQLTDVSSQAQLYLSEASGYNKQLAELEIQSQVLESIDKYVSQPNAQLVPSTLSIQDPTLLGLISKFNELQMERERMLRTAQPSNPIVRNMNEQIANLRINILENLGNIRKSLTITRTNLQAKSGQFGYRIRSVPVVERQLVEITRQQEIKQSIYLYLLQKKEESALSLAAAVSNIRMIDSPVASGPVSPVPANIFIYSFLLGLVFPIGVIYLKGLLNNKVESLNDVERATATPILGEIASKKGKSMIVVSDKSKTLIAEMFRLIRTNLRFSTMGKENVVLLVTSARSGEGKTFFSVNLAASLATGGKKVAILDFDLRKPDVAGSLSLTAGKGITNYLISDDIEIDEMIRPSKMSPDLWVIGSGPVPPNPNELMMTPKVEQLIGELKARFDYIVIDTPPVGQVADAFSLAPFVDSMIYIVRYGYTDKNHLAIINDIYVKRKFNHPLIVLNDVKRSSELGYAFGYSYTYSKKSKRNVQAEVSK